MAALDRHRCVHADISTTFDQRIGLQEGIGGCLVRTAHIITDWTATTFVSFVDCR